MHTPGEKEKQKNQNKTNYLEIGTKHLLIQNKNAVITHVIST